MKVIIEINQKESKELIKQLVEQMSVTQEQERKIRKEAKEWTPEPEQVCGSCHWQTACGQYGDEDACSAFRQKILQKEQ